MTKAAVCVMSQMHLLIVLRHTYLHHTMRLCSACNNETGPAVLLHVAIDDAALMLMHELFFCKQSELPVGCSIASTALYQQHCTDVQ
jgi:hypothetical protein